MRALVEGHVEVFALLRGAGDAPADDGILEGGGGGADFAVDDGVFVGGAGGDGAVEGVFAQVVHYAGDFADLGELLEKVRGVLWDGADLGHFRGGLCWFFDMIGVMVVVSLQQYLV